MPFGGPAILPGRSSLRFKEWDGRTPVVS